MNLETDNPMMRGGMPSPDTEQPMQMGQPPETEAQEPPEEDAQDNAEREFNKKLTTHNVAKSLDKEKLQKIGHDAKRGYETDKLSRKHWEKELAEWTKLALQIRETKSFPWAKSSNVKYPLLSTASMQFNARAYPSLVPSDGQVVKAAVIGKDPTGSKKDKAERVSKYMSYQLMDQMENWQEDMDKLLMILPIAGTLFKKTYWNVSKECICSELVYPQHLVVNYWADSLENAERISEIITMPKRVYKARIRQGVFVDVDLPDPQIDPELESSYINDSSSYGPQDEAIPYIFIEQHTYLDLDDDGYEEPYIITFEKNTGKVVRIVARYDSDDIKTDDKGKIVDITPHHFYTKFSFIPNPDGGFYSIGFGILLGPLNETVNTLINQLVDSGTLSTLQGGFIGKGLRLKMGEQAFTPGEWKAVNASADDLRKQIIPLPFKEPSNVLFQLMGSLISSGKELASVAEIFVGKMPGQNTPATTTMATIEQGMKVFTAVYKRIYRSLEKEFKIIFYLNSMYTDPNTVVNILDVPVGPEDFDQDSYDICPGADPSAISQTEKLLKAQGLMELLQTGVLDPIKVVSRILEAQEQPNYQDLFTQQVQQTGQMPPPPPDPKVLALQAKAQSDGALAQQEMAMRQQQGQQEMQVNAQKAHIDMMAAAQKLENDKQAAMLKASSQQHMDAARIAGAQHATAQKLAQNDAMHKQKLQQMKETVKSQPSKHSGTGKPTPSRKK